MSSAFLKVAVIITSILSASASQNATLETEDLESPFETTTWVYSDQEDNKNIQHRLAIEVYNKAYCFMKRSKAFGNLSFDQAIDFVDNVDLWEEPKYLQERFPYYLSGYDFEDRPIWISELGRYDVREIVEKGPESMAQLVKYGMKACIRMLRSTLKMDTKEKEVRELMFVADWEGLELTQIMHMPTVAFVLELLRTYVDIIYEALGQLICINVNHIAEMGFDLGRPVLGRLFEKFEIYGNNKAKWMAALRRTIPAHTIPTWYGGSSSYKPLQAFG